MQTYIGTKILDAIQMSLGEYKAKGYKVANTNPDTDEGYLVEYADGGLPNTADHKGYVSWSPKEVFEKHYRKSGELNFGDALMLLKLGFKVARKGWNGKEMFLALQKGTFIPRKDAHGGVAKCLADEGARHIAILPHIDMKAADGSVVVGWLASQTDMLSEDWEVL